MYVCIHAITYTLKVWLICRKWGLTNWEGKCTFLFAEVLLIDQSVEKCIFILILFDHLWRTQWQFNWDRTEVNTPQELGWVQKISNINCLIDHIQFTPVIVVEGKSFLWWSIFRRSRKYLCVRAIEWFCKAKSIRNVE